MFVVEVEIVKHWTDRGNNDWVKVGITGARIVGASMVEGEEVVEFDVKPEALIQLKRTLVETFGHSHDDS